MLGVLLCLSLVPPTAAKIDPEPPPKSLAGEWRGVWAGTRFTAHLNPDGSYHEDYGGVMYAGTWRYYPRSRVLEIQEQQVPMASGPVLYSLTVERCRTRAHCAGSSIRMRRRR